MLAKYMKNKNIEYGQEILDFMVKNAVDYAYNQIEEMLEEQEKEYEFNIKYDTYNREGDI
jgi:hypothetical protein